MTLVSLSIITLMVVLNGVFAAYEIALASVSSARLKLLADEKRRGAHSAWLMKQGIEGSLAVVQLGITLVGAVAAATGGAGADEWLAPWLVQRLGLSGWLARSVALTLIVIPLSAVTIVVGELIPKAFALRNKEWVTLKLSPAMRVLALVVWPAVWLLEGAVRTMLAWGERRWRPRLDHSDEKSEIQELRAIVAMARTSRVIGVQEERIILGAARLSDRTLEEITIPLQEVITLDLSHSLSDALIVAHSEMHTRFPVCREPGDKQTICGYVNFKDIVSTLRLSPQEPSLKGIVRTMVDLPQQMIIATGLEKMVRGHLHIALIRNESQQIVGMITLEDILEELVGDIEDEYDRIPAHLIASGSGWVMGGGVPLARLEQTTGVKLHADGVNGNERTLNDWIRARLGRAPQGSDVVQSAGLRVLVRKVRRQNVLEAQVATAGPPIQARSASE